MSPRIGPHRLGRPGPGVARYLTLGESEVTGLTRNCIVFVTHESHVYLMLRNTSGWSEMIGDRDWALEQLTKFWEK